MRKIVLLIFTCMCLFVMPTYSLESHSEAIFAGGCFWCLEHDLEEIKGIISVVSGYSGGDIENPSYQNHRGHQETVLVTYDPKIISFDRLLRSYLRNIDPYDAKGQFCDRGDSYRPVVFFMNDKQLKDANEGMNKAAQELSASIEDFGVQIKPAKEFWIAESYHQDYAQNNKLKYSFYRYGCGRDKRLEEVWGSNKASSEEWKK